MNMPAEGVFHNLVIVSIDKRFPMQARRLMHALWGMGQMSFVKIIIVVDGSVNVHNIDLIVDHILSQDRLDRGLFFSEGILDVLNHASDRPCFGSKLGIDITAPLEGEDRFDNTVKSPETGTPPSPDTISKNFPEIKSFQILKRNVRLCVAFATLDEQGPGQGLKLIEKFMNNPDCSTVSVLIVLEGHEDVNDLSTLMWKLLNNIDPKRDFHIFENRLGIDVTCKTGEEGYLQDWPAEIEMSDEIKQRVDNKWQHLFNEQ